MTQKPVPDSTELARQTRHPIAFDAGFCARRRVLDRLFLGRKVAEDAKGFTPSARAGDEHAGRVSASAHGRKWDDDVAPVMYCMPVHDHLQGFCPRPHGTRCETVRAMHCRCEKKFAGEWCWRHARDAGNGAASRVMWSVFAAFAARLRRDCGGQRLLRRCVPSVRRARTRRPGSVGPGRRIRLSAT